MNFLVCPAMIVFTRIFSVMGMMIVVITVTKHFVPLVVVENDGFSVKMGTAFLFI